jgi:hypothetical protein
MLDAGCRMQDAGCRMPDARCRMLGQMMRGGYFRDPGSKVWKQKFAAQKITVCEN